MDESGEPVGPKSIDANLLSVAQAADTLGLSATTLQQQIRNGVLPATKRGNQWIVTGDAVRRYRDEHKGKRGFASRSHPFHGQRPPARDRPDTGTHDAQQE